MDYGQDFRNTSLWKFGDGRRIRFLTICLAGRRKARLERNEDSIKKFNDQEDEEIGQLLHFFLNLQSLMLVGGFSDLDS